MTMAVVDHDRRHRVTPETYNRELESLEDPSESEVFVVTVGRADTITIIMMASTSGPHVATTVGAPTGAVTSDSDQTGLPMA